MKARLAQLSLIGGLLCLSIYLVDVLFGKLVQLYGWPLPKPFGPVEEFLLVLLSATGVVTCAVLWEQRTQTHADEPSVDQRQETVSTKKMKRGGGHDQAHQEPDDDQARIS